MQIAHFCHHFHILFTWSSLNILELFHRKSILCCCCCCYFLALVAIIEFVLYFWLLTFGCVCVSVLLYNKTQFKEVYTFILLTDKEKHNEYSMHLHNIICKWDLKRHLYSNVSPSCWTICFAEYTNVCVHTSVSA